MQIRTSSMSAMLAITKHGVRVCVNRIMVGQHNGGHGGGTDLHVFVYSAATAAWYIAPKSVLCIQFTLSNAFA